MEINGDLNSKNIGYWEEEKEAMYSFMKEYSIYGESTEKNQYSWNDYHINLKKHSMTVCLSE